MSDIVQGKFYQVIKLLLGDPGVDGGMLSTNNPLPVKEKGDSFLNIAAAATTVVKTGAGILRKITVNKAILSGVITVYDNTAASGPKIATITNPAVLLQSNFTLSYDVAFANGLTVVTSAADDITVVYE